MDVRNRAGLSDSELAGLAAELESLESLSDVIRWGRSQPAGSVVPAVIRDVVIQDEFTHDAIVPWRDRALVFGAT
ncbi:MAG TPA: hypothetical protein VH854_06215 [Thermoanaerobaculia bacterium]|nr:hypothetical protein [Thermoanaerobaculia bacterium]